MLSGILSSWTYADIYFYGSPANFFSYYNVNQTVKIYPIFHNVRLMTPFFSTTNEIKVIKALQDLGGKNEIITACKSPNVWTKYFHYSGNGRWGRPSISKDGMHAQTFCCWWNNPFNEADFNTDHIARTDCFVHLSNLICMQQQQQQRARSVSMVH